MKPLLALVLLSLAAACAQQEPPMMGQQPMMVQPEPVMNKY